MNNEELNIFFDVDQVPINSIMPKECNKSKKEVVRKLNSDGSFDILAVVGPMYKLKTNKEIYLGFEEILFNNYSRDNVVIKDSLSSGGVHTVRTYIIQIVQDEINPGDIVQQQIKLYNSYSERAFKLYIGAYRLVCKNGLVSPIVSDFVSHKHTKNLNVEEVYKDFSKTMELYRNSVEMWKEWTRKKINIEKIYEVLNIDSKNLDNMNGFQNDILINIKDEIQRSKPTVWAFYNALTYYSTHGSQYARKKNNDGLAILEREKTIKKIIDSSSFKNMCV